MIKKSNKPVQLILSYRPISLLTIFSKLFEKVFVSRLLPVLEKLKIILGLISLDKHGTSKQNHRIIKVIFDSFGR